MSRFDRRLDRVLRVAPQRWVLGATGVVAAVAASLVAGSSGGGQSPLVVAVVVGLAVGAVLRPATHTALTVLVVVRGMGLATTDDELSPLAIGVAVLLFVFHTVVALLAVVPVTARVEPRIGRRWGWRAALVGATTFGTWLAVIVMDQRRAAGSVALTLSGFVTVTVLVLALATQWPPRRRCPQ